MALHIYDTRRRRKVPFEPIDPGIVRFYTCGPTVYNDAHIGNFRTYVFEDLLRRTFKYLGYNVRQVMNLTDIDDKTIRQARAEGVPLAKVTAPIIERFFRDLDALKIERAEVYPKATEHIPEMIALIEKLIERGYAYIAEGNVYYSVEKFGDYLQLSGKRLDQLRRGVRINADEYDEKDDYHDFALWKGWTEDDGDVWWESPWGRGRPGWHLECSAMSMKYLGEEFDLHTGGVDNIFPHHENEIAQSVAATGKGFSRYWMHCAHLVFEGEKMSKSLGNICTLRESLTQGYSARVIRYVLIGTHYRQGVNYSVDTLISAKNSLARLDTLYFSALNAAGPGQIRPAIQDALPRFRQEFVAGLEDDLNIAVSLAALFEMVSSIHRLARDVPLNRTEGAAVVDLWEDFDRILGLLIPEGVSLPDGVEDKVRQRLVFRKNRQFKEADVIREELQRQGFTLEDGMGESVVVWSEGRRIVKIDSENY